MEFKAYKCDNPQCGKILTKTSEIYRPVLKTFKFVIDGSPGPDYQSNKVELQFCEKCAKRILDSLEAIVKVQNE